MKKETHLPLAIPRKAPAKEVDVSAHEQLIDALKILHATQRELSVLMADKKLETVPATRLSKLMAINMAIDQKQHTIALQIRNIIMRQATEALKENNIPNSEVVNHHTRYCLVECDLSQVIRRKDSQLKSSGGRELMKQSIREKMGAILNSRFPNSGLLFCTRISWGEEPSLKKTTVEISAHLNPDRHCTHWSMKGELRCEGSFKAEDNCTNCTINLHSEGY